MTPQRYRSPGQWRKSSHSTNGGDCVEIGMLDLVPVTGDWRKSSRSTDNGECVEVGVLNLAPAKLLAIRDSKDPDGPRLHVTPAAWATFTTDVAADT